MDKLHDLAGGLRRRVVKLKKAARLCLIDVDRLALGVRADEAERCAAMIEATIKVEEEKGDLP